MEQSCSTLPLDEHHSDPPSNCQSSYHITSWQIRFNIQVVEWYVFLSPSAVTLVSFLRRNAIEAGVSCTFSNKASPVAVVSKLHELATSSGLWRPLSVTRASINCVGLWCHAFHLFIQCVNNQMTFPAIQVVQVYIFQVCAYIFYGHILAGRVMSWIVCFLSGHISSAARQ
jgi:hypothetical protein